MTMFPTSLDLSGEVFVCAKCLELTSLGELQRCSCEPKREAGEKIMDCPSGYHLCWICARGLAGGQSKYSWEVCFTCHGLIEGLLPYGRHSFMNGLGISLRETNPEGIKEGVQKLIQTVGFGRALADWGKLQAHYLLSNTKRWSRQELVALSDWEREFSPDIAKSTKATEGFLGVRSLKKWKEERGS